MKIDSWETSHLSLKLHTKDLLGMVQIGEVWSKSVTPILV